ncbi:hypothetical protein [Flavobacterium hydatis]|uniref:SEC-C motif domain protein n=1 Tax=Flavobacterium hydatis TaxID=991 RepID=A0A086AJS3_FLAHY|nr:hypothetical protein [Flavobacterium hydatis]KFF16937.1 hypothetical protein IW20_09215 [Flavobacterium hydatis]OXA97730.1 hypothetical protein B0A62_02410 [Flavobacterium hydatis]
MDLGKKCSLFERDFGEVKESFPKLSYGRNRKNKIWIISGELDICDVKGNYWNTFDIKMIVPESYPYCVPIVLEISEIIPRNIDWHISENGICCLDFDNNLILLSRHGINLRDFITKKIYPFFANQLYKLQVDKYAGEEYKHYIEGLIQYYIEDLKIPTIENIVVFLEQILNKKDLTRNRLCPCKSGEKIKNCHEKIIETIKTIGREKISSDLAKIKKKLVL